MAGERRMIVEAGARECAAVGLNESSLDSNRAVDSLLTILGIRPTDFAVFVGIFIPSSLDCLGDNTSAHYRPVI